MDSPDAADLAEGLTSVIRGLAAQFSGHPDSLIRLIDICITRRQLEGNAAYVVRSEKEKAHRHWTATPVNYGAKAPVIHLDDLRGA